jgi:hypothetical protein
MAPVSDVFFAISPDLTSRLLRATGMHDYFASEAKARPGN